MVSPSFKEDSYNTYDSDSVVINGFMFCAHGFEHCHMCTVDHRLTNNIAVEDYLEKELTEEEKELYWDQDDRRPFNVTDQWLRLPNKQPGCIQHKKVACNSCFNWGEQIVRDIRNQ